MVAAAEHQPHRPEKRPALPRAPFGG